MATEFETFYYRQWPQMLEEVHKSGDSWDLNAAVLWERAGGRGVMSDWERELDQTVIPPEAWSHRRAGKTEPADFSWDRRAAWMVYVLLRSTGQTLNESSDLFG